MIRRTYIAEDHEQRLELTFPDGMVPPGSITLDEPPLDADGMVCGPPRKVAFWYNPQMPDPDQGEARRP